MPKSQQPIEGQQIMISRIVAGPCHRVLDVGAGSGRWGQLLKGKVENITAIEIWPEYVERYRLRNIYDEVIVADARDFNGWDNFDVVILGDVLEHMERTDSLKLIAELKQASARVYLTIPITPCSQDGGVYRNPYETHMDEWTHEELGGLGWKLLHSGPNPNGRVQIGTYVLNQRTMIKTIDQVGSYSAAGIFPPKLLQSDEAINEDGLIIPLHLQLLPTNVCNQNCSFCSCKGRDKKLSLPWEKTERILHAFASLGTKAMTVTGGGEPLLYPKINELFELAMTLGIRVGLVTNGTPDAIENLSSTDLTWVRVSVSDKMKLDASFLDRLHVVVTTMPQIDWAFSYVLTRNPDYGKLAALVGFAENHSFTHIRVVSDLMDLDNVPEMDEVRVVLARIPGEQLVIYQGRKAYTKGQERCLISLLKPTIGPDGGVWPCCGVQYALPQPTNDMEPSMRMGDWTDFQEIMREQRCFNGSGCACCYYESYNHALDLMTRRIQHKEFV